MRTSISSTQISHTGNVGDQIATVHSQSINPEKDVQQRRLPALTKRDLQQAQRVVSNSPSDVHKTILKAMNKSGASVLVLAEALHNYLNTGDASALPALLRTEAYFAMSKHAKEKGMQIIAADKKCSRVRHDSWLH
jgi:hypothetical protein